MRYLLTIIVFLTLLIACASNKYSVVEGDLYFKLIDFYKIYDAPDSIISKIEREYPLIPVNLDTVKENDRKFYEIVKYGIKNKLLRTPYIWIETNKGNKVMLFMDKEIFRQFERLKCFDLREQKKKVHILVKVQDISFKYLNAYKVNELVKAETVNGETKCE
jgi:hypothetical protein